MNSPPNSRIARAGCVQSRLSCTASNRSQSIDFFHISQKRRYAVIPHSPFTRASIDLSAQKKTVEPCDLTVSSFSGGDRI